MREGACASQNETMITRRGRIIAALAGAPLLLVGVGMANALGGCNDDPVHFGPAGGLAGRTPDDQVPPSGEGGSSSGSSGASGGCAPGTLDAGCPSFATDIYTPLFAAAGTYKCAQGGCHATGGTAPLMSDAPTTLTNFKKLALGTKPTPAYVNVACGDPAQSTITCNLLPAGPGVCGSRMPSGGADVSAADLTKIKQWIACGAPP